MEEFNFDNVIEYASDSSGYIDEQDETGEVRRPNIFEHVARVISLFQCRECDFTHKSLKVIYEHFCQTHVNEPEEPDEREEILVCGICYRHYLTIDDIRNHMIETHGCMPKIESVKKENCSQNDAESVESEDDEESNPVVFQQFKSRLKTSFIHKCAKKGCLYKFESKEKQKLHENCHVSDSVDHCRDFKCYECGETFKNWRLCGSHLWKEHKIDVDLLKCPLCKYKAFMAVKIWRHSKVHGQRHPKIKKKPPSKDKTDATGSRWYSQKTCDICSRVFANSKTLSKHVKTVHNKIKPFICNVCGRKSARKITWMVHMRQHTGEKPLQCKYCPFRANDPSVLKKHEMRHSRTSQYKCKSCKYSSIQSAAYKAHVKSYHPEDYKELACDQCSYVSVSPDMLSRHKLDHKKGLIKNEDSCEGNEIIRKNAAKENQLMEKPVGNVEISSDCFLPLESTDSIAHDLSIDTGGVTIPAHSEDTQFPTFISP